jgi:hypothetical protein
MSRVIEVTISNDTPLSPLPDLYLYTERLHYHYMIRMMEGRNSAIDQELNCAETAMVFPTSFQGNSEIRSAALASTSRRSNYSRASKHSTLYSQCFEKSLLKTYVGGLISFAATVIFLFTFDISR